MVIMISYPLSDYQYLIPDHNIIYKIDNYNVIFVMYYIRNISIIFYTNA